MYKKFKSALYLLWWAINNLIWSILMFLAAIYTFIFFPISVNGVKQYADSKWNIFRILVTKWFKLTGGFK